MTTGRGLMAGRPRAMGALFGARELARGVCAGVVTSFRPLSITSADRTASTQPRAGPHTAPGR
jgi:hypothetical protein